MKAQTVETTRKQSSIYSYLSLFTSMSTLLCCALPSVLVLLGMGATVASALSFAPFLVTLSHHKVWVFSISGTLIALSFIHMYAIAPKLRAKELSCDPRDPSACDTASRFSRVVLWLSAALYAIGFFVAFVLGPILARMDQG
jgi:mercuric ion transport protein